MQKKSPVVNEKRRILAEGRLLMDFFERMSEEGIAAYFYYLWKKGFGKKKQDDNSTTHEEKDRGDHPS